MRKSGSRLGEPGDDERKSAHGSKRRATLQELRLGPDLCLASRYFQGMLLMPAQVLDGKETARELREQIGSEVAQWIADGGPQPILAAVLIGDDSASQVYVRNKNAPASRWV